MSQARAESLLDTVIAIDIGVVEAGEAKTYRFVNQPRRGFPARPHSLIEQAPGAEHEPGQRHAAGAENNPLLMGIGITSLLWGVVLTRM